MEKGTKIALGLGLAGGVAAFALWPKDAKASAKTSDEDALKALSDAAAKGCADGAADKLAGKASKVALTTGFETPSTAQQAYDKAYAECYKLGTIPVTGGGTTTPPVVTTPPKPATIIFDPAKAKDPARAHSLAVAIGNSPAVGVSGSDIAPDGTYASLAAYAKYGPNAAGLMALQDASGITPDGKYGGQTQRAFDYFISHTS